MAVTNRLFTYSATPIPGASQSGNLAISTTYIDGYTWWGGPDENLGYVIAHTDTTTGVRTERNGASTINTNTVGFWRSATQSDSSFISLFNGLFNQNYATASTVANWLNSNGYWTSWSLLTSAIQSLKTRVLNDAGSFEAESCLDTQLSEINNQNLLDSASLIVTPNGYKESKLYSVIPSDISVDMDVVRATRATRVNSDGLIENVPYNIFTRSEEFENATWTKQRASILTNNIIAPNGTLTGENLVANNGVTYSYIGASGVNIVCNSMLQSATIQTISFYLKYNGLNRIRVMYGGATTMVGNIYVEVDLQSGTITDTSYGAVASNGFIEDAGNGWYRVGFNAVLSLSTTNNRFGVGLGDSTKTNGNGSDGVYIWGAQLVFGTQAKTYLPVSTGFNIPRLDYTNSSCPSILIEPQRTNLLTYSEDFSQAYWNKQGGAATIILPNVEISPDGNLNADKLYTDTSGSVRGVFTTNHALNTYTFSIFAKKGGKNFLFFYVIGSSATSGCWFNLDLGSIGTVGSAWSDAVIQNYGNGWYRCSATVTITNASNWLYYFFSDVDNSVDVTTNGTDGIFIWGAQLEVGESATSYIPTTSSSTVTRNADVISKTAANNLIGQTEGSVYLEFFYPSNITTNIELFNLWNALGSYIIRSRINSAGTDSFSTIYSGNGGLLHPTFSLIPNTLNKIVIIYDYSINTSKVFHNGVLIGSTVGVQSYPTTSQDKIGIGTWFGSTNTIIYNQIAIWKNKITDSQAIALTTL